MLRILLVAFIVFAIIPFIAAEYNQQDIRQKAHKMLQEILDSREFAQQNPSPSWTSKILDRFLDSFPDAPGWANDLLEWLFYLILALIAIFVLIFFVRYIKKLPSLTKTRNMVMEDQRSGLDHEALRTQAYEYFQKGKYRLAIRYLYISLLLYLDKVELLVYETGKTDGEYVREFSRNSDHETEGFAAFTTFFERKWYGAEESSAEDFQQCENILRRFGI